MKELKDKFGATKILSAAVAAPEYIMELSYDVVNMNQLVDEKRTYTNRTGLKSFFSAFRYLDLINIMSYDYHGSYDGITGQTSPLYASNVDTNVELNQNASINAWIRAGASPQKLLLGIALYGRSYTLSNANDNKVGATISGAGAAGPYTLEAGILSYLEVKKGSESALNTN